MPLHFDFISFVQAAAWLEKPNLSHLSQLKSNLFQVQIKSKRFHQVFLDITINKWHRSYIPSVINHLCMLTACFKTANALRAVDKLLGIFVFHHHPSPPDTQTSE